MERITDFPDNFLYQRTLNTTIHKIEILETRSKLTTYLIQSILLLSLVFVKECKESVRTKLISQFKSLSFIFLHILSVAIVPAIFVTLFIFGIVRKFVDIYLYLKFGKIYGGLLNGGDTVWAIEDESNNIINIAIIVNIKHNNTKALKSIVRETIEAKFFRKTRFAKLSAIKQKQFGYFYLLKNQYTAEDCVSYMKTINENKFVDKEDLEDIIGFYSNKLLPKENSALWQILVGTKPVNWVNNSTTYPILLRIHHAVGDGSSLVKTLVTAFADRDCRRKMALLQKFNTEDLFEKQLTFTEQVKHTLLNFLISLKLIFYDFCLLFVSFGSVMHQTRVRGDDMSILHGEKLSGEKLTVFCMEDEENIIKIAKSIKKNVPNTRFSDVILTAISQSLLDYFNRKSVFPPYFATAVIPAFTSDPNVIDVSLGNTFSVGMLNLPISMYNEECMLSRLEEVKKQANLLRDSYDYKINYWLLSVVCGVLPEPILRMLLKANKSTMVISNVPGSQKVTILNGCNLEDVIFFIPHRGTTGVGFSIMTYDNRFQLGLSVDKALISSKTEAQDIIRSILNNIKALHEECLKIKRTH